MKPKALAKIALTLPAAVSVIAFPVYAILAKLNPILLINKDPKARIFLDGDPVTFDHGATGITSFEAWKPTYRVLVQTPRGNEERRIYPWATESNSGSVAVTKKSVEFNLRSQP